MNYYEYMGFCICHHMHGSAQYGNFSVYTSPEDILQYKVSKREWRVRIERVERERVLYLYNIETILISHQRSYTWKREKKLAEQWDSFHY